MLAYTLDLAVAQLNAVLAAVVMVVNVYAAREGNPSRRWLYVMSSVLAGIYVGSYAVLLADFPSRILAWSRIMRGVSLAVWVVVWIVPPLFDVRRYKKNRAVSERLVAGVLERLKDVKT